MFSLSSAVGTLMPLPSACSTVRIADTMRVSSSGSSDARWSGPGSVRSSVRCFSTIVAPRAAAAIGTTMPGLWSDRPTARPNRFANVSSARRLTLS